MSSDGGTVSVNITYNQSAGFIFQQTSNTTGGAVTIQAGKRLFEVTVAGTYLLAFTATNFQLDDPPIGFPEGDPAWLTLLAGYTATQFTVQTFNSGLVDNQTGTFLIHKSDGAVVDPTVINNPIGTVQRAPVPEHRSVAARA